MNLPFQEHFHKLVLESMELWAASSCMDITIYLHFAALRYRKAEEVQSHSESTSFRREL